ncbi:MAG: hydrolase, partial [Pseudomonadota bacterium]
LEAAVHIRFGLPPVPAAGLKKLIKRADRASAWFEATQLAGFDQSEAARYFPRPRFAGADKITLVPRAAEAVQADFVARFSALTKQTAA